MPERDGGSDGALRLLWEAYGRCWQNLVAWLVLSLFLYVLLLSSCWVCTECRDCGPYPPVKECIALKQVTESKQVRHLHRDINLCKLGMSEFRCCIPGMCRNNMR